MLSQTYYTFFTIGIFCCFIEPLFFFTENIELPKASMEIIACPNDIFVASQGDNCSALVGNLNPDYLVDPALIDTLFYRLENGQEGTGELSTFTFPVGLTSIQYFARSGNSFDTCTFTVTVEDQTAPKIDCPANVILRIDGTVESDPDQILLKAFTDQGCNGITLFFNPPAAIDNCDPEPTITQVNGLVPGSSFPLGEHLLRYSYSDRDGNESFCEFSITVLALENLEVMVSPNAAVCEGSLIQLLPGGNAGFSYAWIGPGNFSSNEISPAIFATPETVGTYFVACTDLQGCVALGNTTLALLPKPIISTFSNSPICEDSLFLLGNIDNNSPPISSWEWEGPCNFNAATQNPILLEPNDICEGVYTLTAYSDGGCSATSSTVVEKIELPLLTIQSSCDQQLCLGESCVLYGTNFNPSPENYVWTSSNPDSGLPDNANQNTISIAPTSPGIYTYSYSVIVQGCASSTSTYTIEVVAPPTAMDEEYFITTNDQLQNISAISNDVYPADFPFFVQLIDSTLFGEIVFESNGNFSYTPKQEFSGTDEFTYRLCLECGGDLCDEATVRLNISYEGICFIPTLITPNGDQTNDRLRIPCLDNGDFPLNSLVVFNQWGDKVFSAAPYENDWEGTWRDQPLPDGTYFYNFRRDDKSQIVNGYFSIYR